MSDDKKTPEVRDAADFGGFEPGMIEPNEGWDPGTVIPRSDDTGYPDDTGSQVPPARDNLGNQLDADGNPVPSVKRVGSRDIDAAWDELAQKVQAAKR